MKASAVTTDIDRGFEDLRRRIMADADHVDIGIHADEGQELVTIAAANEFGATIHHPGGTAWGYETAQDASKGKIRFLKKGAGYAVLGVTGPHVITIPMRSFIRSTVDENGDKYQALANRLIQMIADGAMNKFGALSVLGQVVQTDIQRKITTLRDPPNAPSTVRRKGSDKPLIDTGHLRSSIRYVVKDKGDD